MGRRLHFFHGTNAELGVGEHVLPPSVTGAPMAHPAWGRPNDVSHASSNEAMAWAFARRAAHANTRGVGLAGAPPPAGTGRARVYRVEPVDWDDKPVKAQMGSEHRRSLDYMGTNNQEWVAPAFRVVDRIDIEPPSKKRWHAGGPGQGRSRWLPETRGNQGTLPLDWTPFAQSHPADVNHPHPDQQERSEQRIHYKELHRSNHFERGVLDQMRAGKAWPDPRWVPGQDALPGLEPGGKLVRGLRKGRRRR